MNVTKNQKNSKGGVFMENITADGKIKTIRCVKATHEDFAKLVKLGKDEKKALEAFQQKWGYEVEQLEKLIQQNAYQTVTQGNETKTLLELYIEMVKRAEQLYAYHNAYHVLMEEGVNELLVTIGIAPDSYDYDFYQLCLEN